MRRVGTTCAAVCLVLMSAARSAANVSMPFPDLWTGLESVDDQSCIVDAEFGRAAIASAGRGSFTWPSPYRLSSDIAVDDTAAGRDTVGMDVFGTPGEAMDSAGADKVNAALPDSIGLLWPAISTRAAGYFGPGRGLPPTAFAGLHTPYNAYAHVDLTDLGETSELDDRALRPHLPSGAIVLGGIAVGLIGWSWRCRAFSC